MRIQAAFHGILAAAGVALAFSSADAGAQQAVPGTALPTGGRVVGGQATISQSGANMAIQQGSARAALDWQTFNIGAAASVNFYQPSASAIALNRVLGADPSQIYGRLSANGQVFLINSHGILFAPGARVDVGGILASTLSMSSDDFMSGRYLLRGDGAGASVVNQGSLRSLPKGYVALIGPTVVNDGTIEAPRGVAALTAASAATVDFMADGMIQIRVDHGALNAEIANRGAIRADGGAVLLTARGLEGLGRAVVNNSGVIEARTVENAQGVVRLGGDDVTVEGRIDASGSGGGGGSIAVLGDRVALAGSAQLDASGDTGGGRILIGGNYQGKGPEQNASRTYVGRDVVLDASARERGDGGTVVLWAQERTEFYGSIMARGGSAGGNGGLVETSGKQTLVAQGHVDASAPHGLGGSWLLDPFNVTISNNVDANPGGWGGTFNASGTGSNVNAGTIQSALSGGTSVTVTTGSSGGETGDITVHGTGDSGGAVTITKSGGVDATLLLQAAGSILVNAGASIQSSSGKLNVTLNSANNMGVDTGSGAIKIDGATIVTNGGDLVLGGGVNPLTGAAVGTATNTSGVAILNNSSLNTGAGNLTVTGQGFGGNAGISIINSNANAGLTLSGGNQTFTSSGAMIVQGANSAGSNGSVTLSSTGSQTLTVTGGGLTLQSRAGSNANAAVNVSASTGQSVNAVFVDVLADSPAQAQLSNFGGNQSVTTSGVDGSGFGVQVSASGAGTEAAKIGNVSTGTQTITVNGVNSDLKVSAGGGVTPTSGSIATIQSSGTGSQTVTVARDILIGGIGTGGSSFISSAGNQTVSSGRNMTLEGGTINSTSGQARIQSAGTQNVTATGALELKGGAHSAGGTNGGQVGILNSSTNLLHVTAGSLTLLGGTSGQNNGAVISGSAIGTNIEVDVTAGNLVLTGGTGDANNTGNVAAIGTSNTVNNTITIDVFGNTTMTGGSGVSASSTAGGFAGVGLSGTGTGRSTTVNFIGQGSLSITGGSGTAGAGALIGAGFSQSSATTNLNISAASISLTPGTNTTAGSSAGARIGTALLNTGSGNIVLSAITGDIALNDNAGGGVQGAAVATGGNVTLNAGGNIAESSLSTVLANVLTATTFNNAGGAISLPSASNHAESVDLRARDAANLTNAPGAITYRDVGGFDVTAIRTAGTVDLTAPADITIPNGNSIVGTGGVTLTSDKMVILGTINAGSATAILRPLSLNAAIDIGSATDLQANTLELSAAELSMVTAGTLEVGRADGTGTLSLTQALASSNVNADTLLLVHGSISSDAATHLGADIGTSGTPFAHHLELTATGNVDWKGNNIYLADGKNLTMRADSDDSGAGTVTLLPVASGGIQVGTTGANTGAMNITGAEISITPTGPGDGVVAVKGTGAQTFIATKGDITIAKNHGDGTLTVSTDSGTQTFDTVTGALASNTGNMTVQGASTTGTSGGSVTVSSGGSQVIDLTGGLTVQSRPGGSSTASATTSAANGQTISAEYVNVFADGPANAKISTSGGNQSLTTYGWDIAGMAVAVEATSAGATASIDNADPNTLQTITVNNATLVDGNISIDGIASGSTARIGQQIAASGTGMQTITGVNLLWVGSAASAGSSNAGFSNTDVSANSIVVEGGTSNTGFSIIGSQGTQTVTATGAIQVTGGIATGFSGFPSAGFVNPSAGLLHITADSITVTGGASGNANRAAIIAGSGSTGSMQLTVGAGGLHLNGGGGGTNNSTTLQAGNSILIDVDGAGGLHMTGGAGSSSGVLVGANAVDTNVTINVTGTGSTVLQGGAGAGSGASVGIFGTGGSTGKTVSVSITTDGDLTLQGGAGGAAIIGSSGNHLNSTTNIGLTVGGELQITGGSNGSAIVGGAPNNPASTNAGTFNIDVGGNTTITGSTNASLAAGIGHFGSGNATALLVNFTGDGSLELIGGPGAAGGAAGIGTGGSQTNATTTLNISAASISATPDDGPSAVARFGHSGAAPGPGNISLTATSGDIILNNSFFGLVPGGAVRTTGNVTLHADAPGAAIIQASLGVVQANTLTATADAGIELNGNNLVTNFNATNTGSGGVQYTQSAGNLLTVTGISQSGGNVVITADDLNITNPVNAGSNTVTLRPTTLSQNINLESSAGAGMSLSPSDIGFVTAGTLDIGRSDNSGTGTMTVSTFISNAQANAGTYRLFAQDINFASGLGGTGSEFTRHLEMRASNNLSISNSTLLFADGVNLVLMANNDDTSGGDLSISNSLGSGNHRTILAGTSAGNTASMHLQGNNISVTDDAGTTMTVSLLGTGTQTVATGGTLTVRGGSIEVNEGTQVVVADAISIQGGGTFGHLSGGTQDITVGAGGITVQGGSGTGNNASISQQLVSGTQTITVNAGNISVIGGTGASGNSASIESHGTLQQINFGSPGGTLQVTGGSVGNDNSAKLDSSSGDITITGSPDITLQGGVSGGATNQGNRARIKALNGTLTVAAHNVSISGGAGLESRAVLGGATLGVTYSGVVQLTGGSGSGAYAAIGNDENNTAITLTGAPGSAGVSLTGGTGGADLNGFKGDAVIGAAGGFNATVTINSRGSIILTAGGAPGFGRAFIGTDSGGGGGDVTLNAGVSGSGSIVLNGGSIKTAGDISLAADYSGAGPAIALNSASSITALGTGNISITGTAHGAGNGVGLGGQLNAFGGDITIVGTGGTASDATNVVGVFASPATGLEMSAGGTVSITGYGGTNTGTGSAQGVGFAGVDIEAETLVTITGTGGSSTAAGAAGVIISNLSHIGGDGNITITGTGGTAGGSSGGSAVGVVIGSSSDSLATATDVGAMGIVTLIGTGGTGNNTAAVGVSTNFSTVESVGGISITGTGGTGATGAASGTGVGIGSSSTVRTALAGDITILGTGRTGVGTGNAVGIAVSDGAVIHTLGIDIPDLGGFQVGTGSISLTGRGGGAILGAGATGAGGANGIAIANFLTANGGSVQSNTGSITLDGLGGIAVTGEARGVVVRASSVIDSIGGGAISITGVGGNSATTGTNSITGIGIGGSTVQTGGDITLVGTGGANATATLSNGVGLSDGALVQALGTGAISITGTGGFAATSGGEAHGIVINSFTTASGATVSTVSGSLTLDGTVGTASAASVGIRVVDSTVTTTTGAMDVGATGAIKVQSSNAATELDSGGTQTISATGGLTVNSLAGGGATASALVTAASGQTIDAKYVEVLAEGQAGAGITNTSGAQSITTTGMNASNEGLILSNSGAASAHAKISNSGTGGQTITVNDAQYLRVGGVGGNTGAWGSWLYSSAGTQTIVAQGGVAGGNAIQVGVAGAAGFAQIAGASQSITAGTGAQSGSITILGGGTSGTNATIGNTSGSQDVTATGNISLTGGTSAGPNGGTAQIFNNEVTGQQTVTANGISLQGGSGTGNFVQIQSSSNQAIVVGAGGLALVGGEGTNNGAFIAQTGPTGTQTVTVTGPISAVAGGNTSNGSNNAARIYQSGSGLQHISAQSVQLQGGGGTTGTGNTADIETIQGSTASQQLDIGSGGLTLTGGTGSGGNNHAGVWVLADNSTNANTNATQEVSVTGGGNISITGGSNSITASSGTSNDASIYQSATGASASQTVTVAGAGNITLAGGPSGRLNSGSISNRSPSQAIELGSGQLSLTGGGGTSGQNHGLVISNVSGAQQTITFTQPGGSISLTGGTGNILVGSQTGNAANIDAQTGNQTIAGDAPANNPSITVTGGPSGGNTGASPTNLGNTAAIRALIGTQEISAGAIQVSGGAGGVDNSGTIQAPSQIIDASSVLIQGGASSGASGGARIGGIGGGTPGPTSLSLTTTGNVTLTGGAPGGANIGSNQAGAVVTDITIDAGGNVTLNDGTVSVARIGSPSANMAAGTISITADGNIALNGVNGIGTQINTTGNVSLHADTPGKSISEAASSIIRANLLTTTSDAGTNLAGTANSLSSFDASNASSSNISLVNTAAPLTIAGISQSGGGNVTVSNTGAVNVAGTILAGGSVAITATGGTLAVTGTGSIGVNGDNVGSASLAATGANSDITLAGDIYASSGPVTLTAGRSISQSTGLIDTVGTLTGSAGSTVSLTGSNTVSNLGAFASGGAFTLNQELGAGMNITGAVSASSGDVTISNIGGLTINAGGSVTASGSGALLQLVGTSFTNNSGTLSAPSGRWLVWSDTPASDSPGSLAFDFKQYGATFNVTTPAQAGNALLYSVSPTVDTISLTGTASRGYNGTTTAPLTAANFTPPTVFAGDSATITFASADYADKNAGTGKNVSATGLGIAVTSSGKPVYGYQIANSSASGAIGEITAAPLTISAATDSRQYEGTTASAGTPTVTSGTVYTVGGDSLTGLSQAFASKNVLGTNGSTLNVNGYSLSDGNGGNNYAVTLQPASGTITPAPLTISAVTDSRQYEGTTASAGTPSLTSGTVYTVGGDSLTGLSQAFASKNVLGTNGSTLNASYTLNDGNGGNNYAVTLQPASGTITKAPLTISPETDSRQYDGTTDSLGKPTMTSGTLYTVGGDGLGGFTQAFASKNVLGTDGSTINVTGYNLTDGNGGNNYAVTLQSTTGTITPAPLSISAVTDAKVFNGTVASAGAPTVTGTVYAGDTLAPSQTFASRDVLGTDASTLNPGYVLNDGNSGNNYQVTLNAAAGTISQRVITVRANDLTLNVGSEIPTTGTFTVTPALGAGDQFEITVPLSTTASASSTAGTYALSPGAVSFLPGLGSASNYTIQFQDGLLTLIATQAPAVTAAISTATSTTSNSTSSSTAPGGVPGIPPSAPVGASAPVVTISTGSSSSGSTGSTSSSTSTATTGSTSSPDTGTSSSGTSSTSTTTSTASTSTTGGDSSSSSASASTTGGTSSTAETGSTTTTASGSTSSTAETGSTTTTASSSTSTTSSTATSDTGGSTSSSTGVQSQGQSQSQGESQGQGQQQASTSSQGGQRQATAGSIPRATPQVLASMAQVHLQKVQSLEKAVSLLEKDPTIADLKPCGGTIGGDCIAVRAPGSPPQLVEGAAAPAVPVVSHLPAIERKVALLIGVSDYEGTIPKLASPVKDVQEIGKIYQEQLGYEVRTLPNADKATIIRELNRLIMESGSNDSVTVMYAGHGHVVEKTQRGYWIPAKASPDDPKQWISNQDIAKALESIPAKQIMLISDSCYSGTLAREAKIEKTEVLPSSQQILAQRSVTVLTSGGEEPVPDQGKDGHSVFAYYYMQQLKAVTGVSNGVNVFEQLSENVKADIPQVPQYGAGITSGHQRGGDYLFEVRQYK